MPDSLYLSEVLARPYVPGERFTLLLTPRQNDLSTFATLQARGWAILDATNNGLDVAIERKPKP